MQHLLRKQLSKDSARDYQSICDTINSFALEVISVNQYIQREKSLPSDSQQRVITQVLAEILSPLIIFPYLYS